MSVYSTDSLEDENGILPRNNNFSYENINRCNLETIKTSTDLSADQTLRSQHITLRPSLKQDTGTNDTASYVCSDKGTETASNRNAIIANRRLADVSRRRRPASSRNGKRGDTERLKRNNAVGTNQNGDSSAKRVTARCSKRLSKIVSTKRNCCPKDDPSISMKPHKKLDNVLAPKVQQARKPRSYLELYHRRFSGPQYTVRSPEGSTLSVCGDSEQEQLSDDGTRSFATPRDDQSELSFYRRIIEGSLDPPASAARSNGTVLQNTISCCTNGAKRDTPDHKSKRLGYRPYTIEEYKTLSIPKLDRSLGPDKVEMQAKREWLMRRRSYGNSVSARNRQRILLQAQKIKSEDAIGEKSFLPPLKDEELDAKTQADSLSSLISEDQETIRKSSSISRGRYSKRSRVACNLGSARRSTKFERTTSFCSPLYSHDIIEDSYLESLRQRHLQEKQIVARIINQTVCS